MSNFISGVLGLVLGVTFALVPYVAGAAVFYYVFL